jgi:lipopolysaccharide assembly outer membrane protein LptD (OstA)
MLVVDEKGARDEFHFAAEPKYKTFKIPNSKDAVLKLVIRYDKKKQSGKIIIFTGNNLMASYDTFSIYANELRVNSQTLEIEAFGDVIMENGLKRERGKIAKLRVEGGKLQMAMNCF